MSTELDAPADLIDVKLHGEGTPHLESGCRLPARHPDATASTTRSRKSSDSALPVAASKAEAQWTHG